MRMERFETFGQALKAFSSLNLMRVTRAYHTALKEKWDSRGTQEFFTVASAAFMFPSIKRRYQPVLDFLTGDALRQRVTLLANETPVPYIPGASMILSVHFSRDHYTQTDPHKYASTWAELHRYAAEKAGAIAWIVSEPDGSSGHMKYTVKVATNALGLSVLRHRSGLPLRELVRLCWKCGAQPRVFFWWLPFGFEEQNGLDYFGGEKVNPTWKPIRTPDVRQQTMMKRRLDNL